MTAVLITGGAGFIGSWLGPRLLDAGHEVRVLDNLSSQIHGELPLDTPTWLRRTGVHFIRGDIRDVSVLAQAMDGVESIVHLAAETGTGQSMYQISHYHAVNAQATANLFELAVKPSSTVKHVLLASSRSVYGEGAYMLNGRHHVPPSRTVSMMEQGQWEPLGPEGESLTLIATPETVEPRPASIYAASKLANEALGRIVAEAYRLKVTALRFQNVYGEGQSLKNPYTGILSIFSNRMRQGLPINIFEDGKESRDFVHVSDVVNAVMLALHRPSDGFELLNVGSGQPTSVMRVAELLRQLLGSESSMKASGDFRAGDIRHCYADLSRVRAVLGFEPAVDIETGLAHFVRWVNNQAVQVDRSEQAYQALGQRGLGRIKS